MDFFQVLTYYNFPNFSLIKKYKSGLLMKICEYYQKPILKFLTFSNNKFRKPRLSYINYTSPTSKYLKIIFMITVLTHISLGTYFETSYLVFSNFWLRQPNLLFLHFTMKILRYFYLVTPICNINPCSRKRCCDRLVLVKIKLFKERLTSKILIKFIINYLE